MADARLALIETLARFGLDSLTSQPNLCRNALRDKLPDSPREAALLTAALEAGVPGRLMAEAPLSDVETVAARLEMGLEQSHGLSPESAHWAVRTWAAALDAYSAGSAPRRRSAGADSLEAPTVLRTAPPGDSEPSHPAQATSTPPAPTSDAPTPSTGSRDAPAAPRSASDPPSEAAPRGEPTVLRTPSAGIPAGSTPASDRTAPPTPASDRTPPPTPSSDAAEASAPSTGPSSSPTPPAESTVLRKASAPLPPAPAGERTTPPAPSSASAAASPSSGEGSARSGERTVLRPAPVAGDETSVPAARSGRRRPSREGWGRRRLIGVVGVLGVVALIGIVLGFTLIGSGDSNGGTHHAASSHTPQTSSHLFPPSTTSSTATSASSSAKSPAPPAFAPISPVLAHRGDTEGYPQETLPAFVEAADHGYTAETDVRWTKDGVPVMNHNPTTGLGMVCRGGSYVVAETSWAVLRSRCRTLPSESKTHRAYGIPTFAETVQQLSRIPGATLFAEVKVAQTTAQNREYLAILRKWHMLSRTVATSFVSSYLTDLEKEARREGVEIRTLRFASAGSPTTLADLQRTHVWGAVFVEEWDKIPALMRSAAHAGIRVGISTTENGDGPAQWSDAKKLGARFVLTDHPSGYESWLAQH